MGYDSDMIGVAYRSAFSCKRKKLLDGLAKFKIEGVIKVHEPDLASLRTVIHLLMIHRN
jgi:hypothetical protein